MAGCHYWKTLLVASNGPRNSRASSKRIPAPSVRETQKMELLLHEGIPPPGNHTKTNLPARTTPTGHGGRATIRGHIPPPCVFPRESGARFIRRRVHASVRVRRPRAATRPAVAYRGRSASRRRACRSSLGGSRPGRTEGRVPVTLMI
jgi:hypothetical protein